MKGLNFFTFFLFGLLAIGSVIYFSGSSSFVLAQGDIGGSGGFDSSCVAGGGIYCCEDNDCPSEPGWPPPICHGSIGGSNCEDCQGTCELFVCCQGPGCDSHCDFPGCDPFDTCNSCGDGTVDPPQEECDDGNLDGGDGCSPYCTWEICGNGIVDPESETCDDGNTIPGDGCDGNCQLEATECNDGIDNADLDSFVDWDGADGIDGNADDDPECIYPWTLSEGGSPCDNDDIILKISSETDAHGEEWNGAGNYDIKICYSEIFGEFYDGGNPHSCSGTNIVVRLSDNGGGSPVTNSHGAVPIGVSPANYIDVCYGDIQCTAIPGGESCAGGFEEVISLSDVDNAQIETREANVYDNGGYVGGKKICCGFVSPDGEIVDVEWHDQGGNEILFAERFDTVSTWTSTSFPEGTVVTFDIWDKDNFLPPDDHISPSPTALVEADGSASFTFTLTQTLIDFFNDGIDCSNGLELFFEASALGSSLTSGQLTVDCEGENDPPKAVISGPKHGQIYFVDVDMEFDSTGSFDAEGDIVEWLWTVVKDGEIENTYTEESFDLVGGFSTPGMRTITLRVTDELGLWDEAQVAILVVDSPYMLAFINKPWHHEIVEFDYDDKRVYFDAADFTYVVDITLPEGLCPEDNPGFDAVCLSGFCPDHTFSPPAGGCEENATIDNSGPPNFDLINFVWTFWGGGGNPTIIEGAGLTSGWKSYSIPSVGRNDKWINLTTSFDQGEPIGEITSRIYTFGQCVDNGELFLETDNDGNYIGEQSTLPDGTQSPGIACSGGDGVIQEGEVVCCPSGYFCNIENPDLPYGCLLGDAQRCEDYDNMVDCDDDPFHVTGPPLNDEYQELVDQCEIEQGGTAFIDCEWRNVNGIDSCVTDFSCDIDNGECIGEECEEPACTIYECIYQFPQSECVDGLITVSYDLVGFVPGDFDCPPGSGSPPGQEICERPPVQVPCGRLNFDLSFFDYSQFIASALVILIIYLVLGLRRKGTNNIIMDD
jgi:cysteine-rich repeat protein